MNTFLPFVRSLANNALCGIDKRRGTYTAEGITALCEGLKGSAVTSLKCAPPMNLHAACTQCHCPADPRGFSPR